VGIFRDYVTGEAARDKVDGAFHAFRAFPAPAGGVAARALASLKLYVMT